MAKFTDTDRVRQFDSRQETITSCRKYQQLLIDTGKTMIAEAQAKVDKAQAELADIQARVAKAPAELAQLDRDQQRLDQDKKRHAFRHQIAKAADLAKQLQEAGVS